MRTEFKKTSYRNQLRQSRTKKEWRIHKVIKIQTKKKKLGSGRMDSKKKTRPRNPALLPKIPVRISGNTPPIDIINKKHLTAGEAEVRRRVEIRAINFGCLLAKKGALEHYITIMKSKL